MSIRAEVNWNGEQVDAEATAAAEHGLALGAEHVLQASRAVVPLEEGTLERSGVASQDGLEAAVSYDTVYAARQHEELTWRHTEGRTAKYLEGPLNAEQGTVAEIIAAELRRALE
ncbi:minor capsid protein [Amycolatopsis kentuckyensis]|uniref:minor capsid protein n=1 Tax=Amycolatopsis kentuckyensis TaxID=218823 RepID=UPI00142D912A|nr:minor capsid protein [Amycolatopsis kentuckyensis]